MGVISSRFYRLVFILYGLSIIILPSILFLTSLQHERSPVIIGADSSVKPCDCVIFSKDISVFCTPLSHTAVGGEVKFNKKPFPSGHNGGSVFVVLSHS